MEKNWVTHPVGYWRYLLEPESYADFIRRKAQEQIEKSTKPDPKDDQNKRVLEVIDEIRELFLKKNDQYVVSPVEILPTESWLHQIRIKSERALQSKDPKKRDEEIRDCIVYGLLALGKNKRNEKV